MTIYGTLITPCCAPTPNCPGTDGCPPGVCPDFEIKRHDTEPPFILSVSDCNGPLDTTDCVVEVSMWAKAKLRSAITNIATSFKLADNIGFEQAQVGDIILMDRKRGPEQMLITGFDEVNKTITVQRGYGGTTAAAYPKGNTLRIFRVLNAIGETNMVREDIEQVDGTRETEVLTDSQLLYHWRPEDTCLPGCYWLEWKLLKVRRALVLPTAILDSMIVEVLGKSSQSVTTPPTPPQSECQMSGEVEWVRRFPTSGEGYLIRIVDSPTHENLGP